MQEKLYYYNSIKERYLDHKFKIFTRSLLVLLILFAELYINYKSDSINIRAISFLLLMDISLFFILVLPYFFRLKLKLKLTQNNIQKDQLYFQLPWIVLTSTYPYSDIKSFSISNGVLSIIFSGFLSTNINSSTFSESDLLEISSFLEEKGIKKL